MSRAAPRPGAARALAARALGLLLPHAGALCGATLGLAADWYGVVAGLVLGYMLDEARAEAAARRAISAFLEDPDGPFPPEPVPGFCAAAALALGSLWPWGSGGEEERGLFERLALGSPIAKRGIARAIDLAAERIRSVAAAEAEGSSLPALERALATRGSPEARELLAEFAYAAAARTGPLGFAAESAIRARLADCGLHAPALERVRELAFPGYVDPWEVLGLEPGSPAEEVKSAYRRLSLRLHPDVVAASEADAAAFRRLREAYESLQGSGKPD